MLEVMRTLRDHEVETRRPVVIVDWTNEEGSRFSPAMVASGVWAGALDLRWAYDRGDIDGKKLGEELERIGYRGNVPCQKFPVHAYYEYHIEPGPHLGREDKVIGAPEGIVCLHWYDVYLKGEANQVGPTPMEGRHDALCAAAEMILAVEALPQEMDGNLVATVGEIQSQPNSRNIIPGEVHFTVDIRSWEDDLAGRAWGVLEKEFRAVAERRGCPVEIEETWRVARSSFDPALVRRVLETAAALDYPGLKMVSGAGHDASYVNQGCPAAMIFVPSIGGRSHVEVEDTTWEDCEAGANVLLHCVLESAVEG
jgi:N-carbamoyl-L-amino-acid hydrolase